MKNGKKISPRSSLAHLHNSTHSLRASDLIGNNREQLSPRSTSSSPRSTELFSSYSDDFEEKSRRSELPVNSDGGWTSGEETVEGDYMDSQYESSYSKAHAYDYPVQQSRRPLLDIFRNGRRSHSTLGTLLTPPLDRQDSKAPRWTQMVRVRKFRRYILSYLLLLCICWISWNRWVEPLWNEHASLRESLDERMKTGKGWFGINLRPKFADIIQVKDLDRDLIPHGGRKRTRLIVVGDVHGCKDERMLHSSRGALTAHG